MECLWPFVRAKVNAANISERTTITKQNQLKVHSFPYNNENAETKL